MAFTYNDLCLTDKDKVRLKLSDTNSSNYLFSDNEITSLLAMEGTINYACAAACRAIAANKALQAVFFSLHDRDVQIDKTKIPGHFINLAKMFMDNEALTNVVEYFDSVDYTVDDYGVIGGQYVGDDELY